MIKPIHKIVSAALLVNGARKLGRAIIGYRKQHPISFYFGLLRQRPQPLLAR